MPCDNWDQFKIRPQLFQFGHEYHTVCSQLSLIFIISYKLNKIGPKRLSYLRACELWFVFWVCAYIETTDNIDFYSENAIYIN